MGKLKIYLAGAMTGLTWEEQNEWRKEIIDKLNDFKCINPCNYYNFEQIVHDSELEVMRFDLRLLKRCDLIIAKIDTDSIGTTMEIAIAYDENIPIIGLNLQNKELHPWIKSSCDKIFNNIDELIDYVNVFYSEY